ncbi:MAG: thioredoxin-disulfide reductase [Candidatus Alcyoniella australis]|nr:thioredoxin-disulfide reductase [Candidatus Alcyoniella australis]
MDLYDSVIIGAGPAGLTAAIYAGRGGINGVLLERMIPGGQIAATELVENYPGFPEGIMGADLAAKMREQALKFGVNIESIDVEAVQRADDGFEIHGSGKTLHARSVILAMGTQPRMLGISGEAEFFGRGVSTCATCDGPLYRGKQVAVIGGGDSAIQEALFLTKFCSRVHVIHRRDALRAVPALGERAKASEKIEIHWDSVPLAVLGDNSGVSGLRLRNVKTDEQSELELPGVFMFIGLLPNIACAQPLGLKLDEGRFILTDQQLATSIPGVFAAGDIRSKTQRQLVTAVGDGAQAVFSVERYLEP